QRDVEKRDKQGLEQYEEWAPENPEKGAVEEYEQ
ncbi:hypothetical protein chiPu_0033037, partial [Chiloscyllium punctatum]|nr:hypothetical protein [Chiloscyllium punctatum]